MLCVGGDADFHPVGLCFEVFATEYAATCCVAAGVWECGEVSVRDDSEWPAMTADQFDAWMQANGIHIVKKVSGMPTSQRHITRLGGSAP